MKLGDLPNDQLAVAIQAAEALLKQIAASGKFADRQLISQLEELAMTCARLAFTLDLTSTLTDSVYNLITWCDHLDDKEWTEKFVYALRAYPLAHPWRHT